MGLQILGSDCLDSLQNLLYAIFMCTVTTWLHGITSSFLVAVPAGATMSSFKDCSELISSVFHRAHTAFLVACIHAVHSRRMCMSAL